MKEITLIPGVYYVGEDFPAGVYIFTLAAEAQFANLSFEKPTATSWYMNIHCTKLRLHLEDKTVFKLDRPVTIQPAPALDFGDRGNENQ